MGKELVRLYPIDIDRMPWTQVRGMPDGIREKVLASDPETGSTTRYLRVDPDVDIEPFELDRSEETYVLSGSYRSGEEFYPSGTYLLRSPGSTEGPISTAEGFFAFQVRDVDPSLDKSPTRLYPIDIDRMPWERVPGGREGHLQKILALGPSGSLTRLLRVEPGGDTTEVDDHEHNEEVLILEGSCKNGEEFHLAGTYTFNPPHAIHGPFLVDELLLCFEVKNQP